MSRLFSQNNQGNNGLLAETFKNFPKYMTYEARRGGGGAGEKNTWCVRLFWSETTCHSCIGQIEASTSPPPPLGHPHDPHALGVGI